MVLCCVKICLDNIFYGSGFVLNGFTMLNNVNVSIKDDDFIYVVQSSNITNNSDIITWHARLRHIREDRLHRLVGVGLLGSLTKQELPICNYCLVKKAIGLPFGKAKRDSSPLQLVHLDIYTRVKHSANYFIIFINDFTRFGYVYLISYKSEVLDCFIR